MEYDVVIVGGGPGGLATAIRLKQLAAEKGQDVSVVVLKRAPSPARTSCRAPSWTPMALTELIPDWKAKGAPLNQPVTDDARCFLSETSAAAHAQPAAAQLLPQPRQLHRQPGRGHPVAGRAGRSPGRGNLPRLRRRRSAVQRDGSVKGVATGNMGMGKEGEPTDNFQLGMELLGKYTIFAEGARGHLGKQLIANYQLDAGRDPQSFGIGIKELWEIDPPSATSPAL